MDIITCAALHSLVLGVNGTGQLQQCDVVVEIPSVEIRMDVDSGDVLLDVRVEFRFVVDVPLAETNSEGVRLVTVRGVRNCVGQIT